MNRRKKSTIARRLSSLALCCALALSTILGAGTMSASAASQTSDPHRKDLLFWLGFDEGKGTTVSDL